MTKITFYRDKDTHISEFEFNGHAGYADEGSDIVCAALSVLVINTLNSIETFTDDSVEVTQDEESGCMNVILPDEYGKDTELLLNALILGVTQICQNEEYSSYVSLIFEEV